jgi:D-alanine-D-alanine ligase-like ATP-grasp enzyme
MLAKALMLSSPRIRDAAAKADIIYSVRLRNAWRHWRDESAVRRDQRVRADTVYGPIWREAADEVGAEVTELGGGFIELRKGASAARVWQHMTQLDDVVTLRLARDKPVVHRLLAQADLPVPEHVVFERSSGDRAVELLDRDGGSWVVKPAGGAFGGVGVTGGIETPSQLYRAALRASRSGAAMLLERQVPGQVFRLLVLDGEVLDVVGRRAPTVTGDGESTIAELVAAENRRRMASGGQLGVRLLGLDLDLLFQLDRRGLELSSVLPDGATTAIKTVTNQNAPTDNQTVESGLSAEVAAEACRAAAAVGVRLAGVDVVAESLGAPLRETGGTIIEVNACPGLHHHYHVADPARATRVAVPVLRRLLED